MVEKDWMQINILVPVDDPNIGPQILGILIDLGFIEYDWCSLYHARSGSVADYGPHPKPKYNYSLVDYIKSLE